MTTQTNRGPITFLSPPKPLSPLWDACWAALEDARPEDAGNMEQHHGGEVWQLLSVYESAGGNPELDPPLWAEFRHRNHPETGGRIVVQAPVCRVGAHLTESL